MIDKNDVDKMAKLARIEISESDKVGLIKDLDLVLGYVSAVQNAAMEETPHQVGMLRNVMREDKNPHASGLFAEEILEEVPGTKEGYVKVKKIL